MEYGARGACHPGTCWLVGLGMIPVEYLFFVFGFDEDGED